MSARLKPSARITDDAVIVASNCMESSRAFGLELLKRFHALEVCLMVNTAGGVVLTVNYRQPILQAVHAMALALPSITPSARMLPDAVLSTAGAHVLAECRAAPTCFVAYAHPRRSVLISAQALGFDYRLIETYLARWHEAWLIDRLTSVRTLCADAPSARFRIRFAGDRAQLWFEHAQEPVRVDRV